MAKQQRDLVERLRAKADEIDRAVSRDKDERDAGNFGEIELLREAADEIDTFRATRTEHGLKKLDFALLWEMHVRVEREMNRRNLGK